MVVKNQTGAGALDEAKLQEPQAIDLETGVAADVDTGVFKVPGVNDQQSFAQPAPQVTTEPIVEPTAIGGDVAPIVEQARQQSISVPIVEQPITPVPVVQPPIEELPPEPAPRVTAEKIETAEDIKTKQLAIQEQEQAQITAKQEQATNEFNTAISTGNLESASNIANQNPELRDVFNSQIRATFKNKENVEFFGKFNGATNDEMKSALESGDIVIGSQQYNLLPPEQRRRFEQFNKLNTGKRTDFTTDNTNVISLEDITSQIGGLFNFDLRAKIEEAKNDPELSKTRNGLESLQNDISEVDDAIDFLEEDLEKEFPKMPRSFILAEKAKRGRDLIRSKNGLVNQYNAKLGTYQDMKSDLDMELKIAQFESSQQQDIYKTSLDLYETRRKEVIETKNIERKGELDKEISVFEAQNNILAEDRALGNAKDLASFKQGLEDTGRKVKTWESRQDGMYALYDDGSFEKVINGGFTKGEDGNTVYTYTGKDGKPIIETYNIRGNIIGASTKTNLTQAQTDLLNAPNGTIIPTRLKSVTNPNGGKECAEYINDIFSNQIGARMGDTYQSKLNVATETAGRLGSLAVWQPNPNNKEFAKFGHAGVIVGESDDRKSWHIKSSNLNLQGQISIVSVPKTAIAGYKSTTLFDKKLETTYTLAQEKLIDSLDPTDLSNTDLAVLKENGLSSADVYNVRSEGLNEEKKGKINSVLAAITDVRNTAGLESAVGFGLAKLTPGFLKFGEGQFVEGSSAANFSGKVDKLVNNILLPNLDLMSGVLSETDIAILKSAGTDLSTKQSEKEFMKTMDTLENKYRESLGLQTIRSKDVIFTDKDGIRFNKQTLKDEFAKQIREFNKTGEEVGGVSASPESINTWIKTNNLKLN